MDLKLRACSITSFTRKNPHSLTTLKKLHDHGPDEIKFIIGSEEIPAHRYILAELSPKYKAQFSYDMYKRKVFNMKDVSPAAFKEFLQFFNTDEVTLTLDNIEDVLSLAKQSLVDECAQFLQKMVGLDKLLWCYRLTFQFYMQSLKEFCSNEIETNIEAIFKTADFLNCDKEMLRNILTLNLLNRTECDVFDACISWARAQCEKHKLDGKQSANLRAVLGEALYKIHFHSMSIEEFTTVGEKYPELLTSHESNDVLRTNVQLKLTANGETSNLFGDNSGYVAHRHSVHKIILKLSTLECALSSSGIRASVNSIQDNNDCIGFICDKAIYLQGIVVFNEIFNDIDVLVSTLHWSTKLKNLTKISNNETKITFDHPIRIDSNKWCYVNVIPKKFDSSIHLDGFRLEGKTQQNGISFEFVSQNFQKLNLITRLLFDIIDKKE